LTALGHAIADVAKCLAAAGISEARGEARLLAAAAAGLTKAAVIAHPERELTVEQSERLAVLAGRRAAREPVSRILGWREFWSLRFALGPDTLDPRPDSETLVAAALELADATKALSILDLGTGSGCLLLAALSELPKATGLGIDLSLGAITVAEANARSLGLASRARFEVRDWGEGLSERFDLILCNPPYIPEAQIATLAPEVAGYEPKLALAAGYDGLESYRRLAVVLPGLLAPGGRAFVEIGAGQAEKATFLLACGRLILHDRRADLAGTSRCLVLGLSG
jgi:release factor glutamine methyltransferase